MKYKPYNMVDVFEASAQKKFNVISTFAGGGGSSTGYRLAGGNILCVNEFVEEARNTYRENYPHTPIMPNDIKELSGDLERQLVAEREKLEAFRDTGRD